MSSPASIQAMNDAWRRHPEAKIGDTFGPFTVTALLPRGYRGRSDERVEWKCSCGKWGSSFVFNLRKAKSECSHAPGSRRLKRETTGAPAQPLRGPNRIADAFGSLIGATR